MIVSKLMSSASTRFSGQLVDRVMRSDRCVPIDMLFIVEFRGPDASAEVFEAISRKWSEQYGMIVSLYTPLYDEAMFVAVFYPEDDKHILEGKHHLIVSTLTSELTLQASTLFTASLIEFETKTQLYWVLAKYIRECMLHKLKHLGNFEERIVHTLTHEELIESLPKDVDWETISEFEKYGTFFRNGKRYARHLSAGTFSEVMSELLA